MSQRYYWLKLKENFFDKAEIKVLHSMENGAEYIILWQQLLLSSLKFTEESKKIGLIAMKENIPWSSELISKAFGYSKEIATGALEMFQRLGMIALKESGEMWALDIEEMIGSESDSAERVRRHRKRLKTIDNKALLCNDDVTKCNTELELEKEVPPSADANASLTAYKLLEKINDWIEKLDSGYKHIDKPKDRSKEWRFLKRMAKEINNLNLVFDVLNKLHHKNKLDRGIVTSWMPEEIKICIKELRKEAAW